MHARHLCAARAHPRQVLLGALLFIVLASSLYFIAPWVLPLRILEGPLVQMPSETGATLIWYGTRPVADGDCVVSLEQEGASREFPASADGARCRAVITGLSPDSVYPYRILFRGHTLAEGRLHINKPPGTPFSFLVFGDSGKGTREQYLLAEQMRQVSPAADFLLHTGDLVYSDGQRQHYKDRFFVPYRHLISRIPFWPCLGNHDWPDSIDRAAPVGMAYFDIFELLDNGPPGVQPERHYWFEYADCRVAVLDPAGMKPEEVEGVLVPWVREVLSPEGPRWKFVSVHYPPFTVGSHRPDLTIRKYLSPVFEQVGVDVVFCGHDHNYQRTLPLRGDEAGEDGVVYVISGAGGARLYDLQPREAWPAFFAAADNSVHSFTHVQLVEDVLRLRQIGINGRVLDEWEWRKTVTPEPPTSETIPAEAP